MTRKVNRNPRVQVTLSPEAMAVLDELATLSEQPKAAIVSELVDVALPAMSVTLEALRVVRRQPDEARKLLSQFAHQQTAYLAQAQLDLSLGDTPTSSLGSRLRTASAGSAGSAKKISARSSVTKLPLRS
ncbi:hypothetical protein ABVD92_23545, partial [Xanthomonas euvesicatoria]